MPRKNNTPHRPSHFHVIYKPPSHSANNNTSNQKQIQQHIPTHTTGKHQTGADRKTTTPSSPGHPYVSASPGCPSTQTSFSAYPTGDHQTRGKVNLSTVMPLGKSLLVAPLFSFLPGAEGYLRHSQLQHYVGKGTSTGVTLKASGGTRNSRTQCRKQHLGVTQGATCSLKNTDQQLLHRVLSRRRQEVQPAADGMVWLSQAKQQEPELWLKPLRGEEMGFRLC